MDIKVTEANKVYVRIQCDFGIAKELSEYFTFRVPNFQFHPLFRKKNKAGKPVWDGKKRLFSLKDHTLYYGLLNKLDKFAKDRDYKIEYELPIDAFNIPPVQEFFDTLGIPKHFVLRDYQLKSIFDCVMNKRALLLSPTSSGKSLINYVITRYLLDFNLKKILIIVPRIQLVHQLFYDFDDYGWETKKYAHPIYAGQDKNPEDIFFITCESGKQYKFLGNQNIKLINNKVEWKQAKELNKTDEIDDTWLSTQKPE